MNLNPNNMTPDPQAPIVPQSQPAQPAQSDPQAPGNPQELQQAKMDPAAEKEVQAYVFGLSKLLHSKQTSNKVVEMLKAGKPEQTIPHTALLLNSQMEETVRAKGKPPSLEVLFESGQFLVGDLIEIGNAAGIFQLETEEQIAPILQSTFQQYIRAGLKNKTIDPIELQQKVEQMMPEDVKAQGLQMAERTGVPLKPDQSTAMEAYAMQRAQKGSLQGGR